VSNSGILYVVWGEDISQGGIFDAQVSELLLELKRRGESIELLLGIPVLTRLKRALQGNESLAHSWAAIDKKCTRLEAGGVRVTLRRIYPSLSFYSQVWAIPGYYIGHISFLRRLVQDRNIGVVHCRSYHAAVIACLARERSSRSFRVVFDTRAHFVEEGVLHGRYADGSASYRAWKAIEKWLLRECDAVVTVSDRMAHVFRAIEPRASVTMIRPCVRGREVQSRAVGNRGAWVYSGNLSPNNPWFSIEVLAQLVLMGKEALGDVKLTVLTARDHTEIRKALRSAGLADENFEVRQARGLEEVARELSHARAGLFPFRVATSEVERRVFDSGVGIKAAEYLAAGLAMICYGDDREVAQLVIARGLGCIVTADRAESIKRIRDMDEDAVRVRERCLEASQDFLLEHVVDQYVELYRW
jgi:hypothetical protein